MAKGPRLPAAIAVGVAVKSHSVAAMVQEPPNSPAPRKGWSMSRARLAIFVKEVELLAGFRSLRSVLGALFPAPPAAAEYFLLLKRAIVGYFIPNTNSRSS